MSLGERISQLRTDCGMSQYQLAKEMGVSRQAVSKWETDQSAPDSIKLIRLADILDTDIEYLSTGRKNFGRRPPVVLTTVETVETVVEKLLVQIQADMLERARQHREEHTSVATEYDEFKDAIENKPGFVKAMWCGDRACEDKIKEDTTATSRCMPFAQETLSDKCVCCGRPAKSMVYWGKAY